MTPPPPPKKRVGGTVALPFFLIFKIFHDTIDTWSAKELIFVKSSYMSLEMDLIFFNDVLYCNLYCKYCP